MLKKLVHPSRFKVPLTADATAKTFTVSTEHASYIDTLRQAYSGTVKMLIIQPPTIDKPDTFYEHIIVSGINLSTGICYTNTMSNYSKYLVTSGSEVCANLIPDGDMEYETAGCWLTSGTGIISIDKNNFSYDGNQGLSVSIMSGTDSGYGRLFNIVSGTSYENFIFSGAATVISGYNNQVGLLYSSYYGYPSSNLGYLICSGTSDWFVYTGCTRFYPDVTTIMESGLILTANSCTIGVDNIILLNNLVYGGSFMDGVADRKYWVGVGASCLASSSPTYSFEKGNSGVGIISFSVANGYVYQLINVIAGTWYTFCARIARYIAIVGPAINYKVKIVGVETSTVYWDSGWKLSDLSYQKLEYTFKILTDSHIEIRIIGESASSFLFYDSISLVPIIETSSDFSSNCNISPYYDFSKWYDNPVSSVLISGSSLLCTSIVSGTNLDPNKGSIGLWYCPTKDYDDYSGNCVVISGGGVNQNFLKVYYNASDYKFYGEVYNGSEWVCSGCVSDEQTFVSGTWMHLAFSYDNAVGTKLFINGQQEGEFYGTWSQQIAPTLMSIGSISGSYGGRFDGFYDSITFYTESINVEDWYKKTLENTDYD